MFTKKESKNEIDKNKALFEASNFSNICKALYVDISWYM